MLLDAGLGPDENYQEARALGLGVLVRSLVGLDQQAAIKAFDGFLQSKGLKSEQQHFILMIIEELTRTGVMDPGRLFESPFVDIAPSGIQAHFGESGAEQVAAVLDRIRKSAAEVAVFEP